MQIDTYPYYAGVLQSTITCMHWDHNIPGIEVKDWQAFGEYLKKKAKEAELKALEYEKQQSIK